MNKNPVLLRMTSPLGEGFEIPYHDFGPKTAKIQMALVGGIHGNELNGIFVLSRLAALLESIEGKKKAGLTLDRRVVIVPCVNILGMHLRQRSWPFDKTDINRMFPGFHLGETTQRIADAVFKLTREAPVRIDIHSSNLEVEELPQVRVYGSDPELFESARQFALPAVIECPINKIASSTLLHAWIGEGGENFVIQAGVAGDLQTEVCDRVLKGLVRFLGIRGVIGGTLNGLAGESDAPEESHSFGLGQTVSILSEKAGLFVAKATLGRWMEKGDVLGLVYDGFDGRVRARIRAPVSGLLTAIRRQALLYQGDLLARLQSRTPLTEGADTYLMGQGQ
jgi:predicted deacylase